MDEEGYWNRKLKHYTLGRRSALKIAATAGAVASAGLLVGCGGGDEGPPASSLLSQPRDTTKQAVPGGTWQHWAAEEHPNLDQLSTTFTGPDYHAQYAYSRFVKYKVGTPDKPAAADVEPDGMESFEYSPDHLQLTFKLRQNLKMDPRPPTNGRPITVDDVKWSWDRFSALGNGRADFSNKVNPAAPIKELEFPDSRTVVLKLAFPLSPLLALLAFSRGYAIMPVEAEDKFDPRKDMRGSGPWLLTNHVPSATYEYKRNPGWYSPGRPFLEGINRPIISEYSQRLAQLKAGNLWQMDISGQDVIPTKKSTPSIVMMSTGFKQDHPYALSVSQRENNPFLDVRVRRALSMLLDRDLWIDTFFNVSGFRDEGIPLETRWHSHYGAGTKYWLDPQGKDLGEGAKYFQHNPDEAQKLLKAAGADGLEFLIQFNAATQERKEAEVTAGMWQDAGLKPKLRPLERQDVNRICLSGQGLWEGVCLNSPGGAADIDQWFSTRIRYGATIFGYFQAPLPKIDDLINQQRREFDEEKRAKIIQEIQREMAIQMPFVSYPGLAEELTLVSPLLANFGAFRAAGGGYLATELYVHYWYDASKRTS